jgi:hypothetical protein
MSEYKREFTDQPAKRERVPLHVAIVGPQKSGKTWSALELATGEQKVFGGDIFLIDTESGRGEHYADYFKYRYVAFPPPHGPLDYLRAIEYCVKKGAGVVITDSMAHEHSGVGGVMWQVDKYLDEKAGDDYHRRAQLTKNAHIRPKSQRKQLNMAIEQWGSKLNGIFCYRAEEKMAWPTGKDPVHLGWQPDTTSGLFYAMTASFLLPPYSNGVPNFTPETAAEKLFIALPKQFRGWWKPGTRLSPEVGQRMAEWAIGGTPTSEPLTEQPTIVTPTIDRNAILAEIKSLLATLPTQEAKKTAVAAAFNLPWAKVERLEAGPLSLGLGKLRNAVSPLAPELTFVTTGDHRDRVRAAASAKGITDQQLSSMVSGGIDDMPPEAEDEVMAAIENYMGREPGED